MLDVKSADVEGCSGKLFKSLARTWDKVYKISSHLQMLKTIIVLSQSKQHQDKQYL